MAIPDFQTIMRPLLQAYADGSPKRIAEAEAELGESFQLKPDELAEMLPSGKQQKFKNRVRWSATYLKNAGALERPERGVYRIWGIGMTPLSDTHNASAQVISKPLGVFCVGSRLSEIS